MKPLVVIGDALLDVDLVGQAHRLMPEAAAPVLDDLSERPRPGGAALAATLIEDREVVLVTALGSDEAAERLRSLCGDVRVVAVPHDGETPVKKRVLAGDHVVARLDSGGYGAVGSLSGAVREALEEAGGVLVADYGQGFVDAVRPLLASVRAPLVWDPHPRGSEPVAGAWLATPNHAEALRFAGLAGDSLSTTSAAADVLVDRWQARAVAVTMGSKGALLSQSGSSPAVVPAPPVVAKDTCGAGDRFAGAAACALADGALTSEAVEQAVAAASAFVSAGGASAVAPARTGTLVATGGCFDLLHAGHVATLEAARSLGDRLVVCLNSDESVRRLKGPDRPLVPAVDRARVLSALSCVDEVIVFEEDTPLKVIERLRPDVWVKGGDYAGATLPEAELLASWGGQAVVVPYLSGRSTTALVELARVHS